MTEEFSWDSVLHLKKGEDDSRRALQRVSSLQRMKKMNLVQNPKGKL
jgi:hypothetical protein